MTKFDPTKPVQARGGRPARIICTDAKGKYPIVVLLMHKSGNEYPETYTLKGEFMVGETNSPNNLVNVPEKRFVNIWKENKTYDVTQQPYTTAEEAKEVSKRCGNYYIAIAVEVDA